MKAGQIDREAIQYVAEKIWMLLCVGDRETSWSPTLTNLGRIQDYRPEVPD